MSLTPTLNQTQALKQSPLLPPPLMRPLSPLSIAPPRMPSHNLPNKKYVPRPFQAEITEKVMSTLAGGVYHRVAFIAPTGTGKTPIFADVIRQLWRPGHPAIVLVHSDHLLHQAQKTIKFIAPGLRVEIEKAEQVASDDADVILCSIQSFARWSSKRYLRLIAAVPSCIVYDECHHAASKQAKILFERLQIRENKIPMIGCTATAERLDKKRIISDEEDAPFQVLAAQYTLLSAMRDKAVCTIRGYRIVTDTDISGVTVTKSMNELERDFHRGQLSAVVRSGGRTAQCYERWNDVASERQTIIFCVDIAHANSVYAYWKEKGVACGLVHSAADEEGNFSEEANRQTRAAYSRGELRVIVNVGMLAEGYDDPPTSCVLLMRPTMSLMCYLQMIGRAYRLFAGKEDCLIIDAVDNYKKHSLTQNGSVGTVLDTIKARTLGSAVGLNPTVDIGESTLLEAAEIAEAMTEKQKARRYGSLADIITYLQEIDIVCDKDKSSRGLSDYSIGSIHGNWKIIGNAPVKISNRGVKLHWYNAECVKCHKSYILEPYRLGRGNTNNKSGKCYHFTNLSAPMVGSIFSHLTVIGTDIRKVRSKRAILCRCNYNKCEKESYVAIADLYDGHRKTCGQHSGQQVTAKFTVHGESGTRLHHSWNKLQNTGVSVYEQWEEYVPLRDWVLSQGGDADCTVRRTNPALPFSPENCRVVHHKTGHGDSNTRLYRSWLKQNRTISRNPLWQEFVPFHDWVLAQGGDMNCTVRRINPALPFSPENCYLVHPEVKAAAGEIDSPAA